MTNNIMFETVRSTAEKLLLLEKVLNSTKTELSPKMQNLLFCMDTNVTRICDSVIFYALNNSADDEDEDVDILDLDEDVSKDDEDIYF